MTNTKESKEVTPFIAQLIIRQLIFSRHANFSWNCFLYIFSYHSVTDRVRSVHDALICWCRIQDLLVLIHTDERHIKHYSSFTYIQRVKHIISLSQKLQFRPSAVCNLTFLPPRKAKTEKYINCKIKALSVDILILYGSLTDRQCSKLRGRNSWQLSVLRRYVQTAGIRLSSIKLFCSGMKKPERHTDLIMTWHLLSFRNGVSFDKCSKFELPTLSYKALLQVNPSSLPSSVFSSLPTTFPLYSVFLIISYNNFVLLILFSSIPKFFLPSFAVEYLLNCRYT